MVILRVQIVIIIKAYINLQITALILKRIEFSLK